jgi:LytTr DNA-binding domain
MKVICLFGAAPDISSDDVFDMFSDIRFFGLSAVVFFFWILLYSPGRGPWYLEITFWIIIFFLVNIVHGSIVLLSIVFAERSGLRYCVTFPQSVFSATLIALLGKPILFELGLNQYAKGFIDNGISTLLIFFGLEFFHVVVNYTYFYSKLGSPDIKSDDINSRSVEDAKFVEKSTLTDSNNLLSIKIGNKKFLVGDILLMKAEDHFVKIETKKNGTHTVRQRLGDLEQEIGSGAGFRPHRSYWVSWDFIDRVEAKSLFLKDGRQIPLRRMSDFLLNKPKA